MAKEKQKMTLNVRKRETSVASAPPPIDPAKIAAFASGAEVEQESKPPTSVNQSAALAKEKPEEQKVIRDAFTMPAEDHQLFAEIQARCLSVGAAVTKSEIVRAGLKYLSRLEDNEIKSIVKAVPKIKTGRPGNSK